MLIPPSFESRPVRWVLLVACGLLLAGCVSVPPAPVTVPTGATPTLALPQFDASLPVPKLVCRDESRCNFEMTPDPLRQGNEVTIAVNPLDPQNIVGGAKDYFPDDAGECVWDGVYVTHDGARTPYNDRSFDGSPWRQKSSPDPSKVNYATQFWCTTDPVAYFDLKGTLYYVLMAYQADPITGSKAGKDIFPQGALNDWAFNRATQIVAISHDGGDSFATFTPVEEGSFPANFHDKAWLAAQNDGSAIHIMWLSSLAGGNQYFRSVDGGKTYGDPQIFATTITGAGQGSFIDVGPQDEVYASWADGNDVKLVRSADKGASWDAPRTVTQMEGSNVKGLSERDHRDGFPALATDKFADSPFANSLYFTWSDSRDAGDAANIYFAASHDGGSTFSPPLRINDDATKTAQFMPAVSISPGGVIDVTWMDMRRDEAGGLLIDQYYTYSLDGGTTWAPNFRVRAVSCDTAGSSADACGRDAADQGWDPNFSHHQNGMIFIGDYLDIDSSWTAAHPVWPDTRSGEVVDVYTATIERPMFANGYPQDKRAEAETFVREHPI